VLLSCVEPLKIVLHLYIFAYFRKPEKKNYFNTYIYNK